MTASRQVWEVCNIYRARENRDSRDSVPARIGTPGTHPPARVGTPGTLSRRVLGLPGLTPSARRDSRNPLQRARARVGTSEMFPSVESPLRGGHLRHPGAGARWDSRRNPRVPGVSSREEEAVLGVFWGVYPHLRPCVPTPGSCCARRDSSAREFGQVSREREREGVRSAHPGRGAFEKMEVTNRWDGEAESQWIVAARLLYHLQYLVPYLSRLQRIHLPDRVEL